MSPMRPAYTPEVAPSILAADFSRLGEQISGLKKAGCRLLHVDVMDGHFVPNISIGVPVVRSLRAAIALWYVLTEDYDRFNAYYRDWKKGELTPEQRAHLRAMGIDPDADDDGPPEVE